MSIIHQANNFSKVWNFGKVTTYPVPAARPTLYPRNLFRGFRAFLESPCHFPYCTRKIISVIIPTKPTTYLSLQKNIEKCFKKVVEFLLEIAHYIL